MSVTTLGVDELVDPGNLDVETLERLDGRELAELFKQLERLRRRTEGALAAVIGAVNERRVHGGDGHSNVNGWCRALGRWSDTECRDRIRTAKLIASCDRFRDAVMCGEIGVAQAHELGRAFANPRCGTQLVDVAEVMVDNATKLSHHEFRITVDVGRCSPTSTAPTAARKRPMRAAGPGSPRSVRRSICTRVVGWRRVR